MTDLVVSTPVIIVDGLLASGSSVISTYVGRSYTFTVINGNQYLRDLGVKTGNVIALQGTIEHELQLLDFYQQIAKQRAAVHDQMYTFLTNQVRRAKQPTLVHCTGYIAYALKKQIPVKQTFWLQATLDDRVERLLHRHQIKASTEQRKQLKSKLQQVDNSWNKSLQDYLGFDLHESSKQNTPVIDTSNLSAELAFQRLASIDEFIDAYNELAPLMPSYHEAWRRWRCLVCQLVSETDQVVLQCPRCHNTDPDKFKDLD